MYEELIASLRGLCDRAADDMSDSERVKKAWVTRHANGERAKEEPESPGESKIREIVGRQGYVSYSKPEAIKAFLATHKGDKWGGQRQKDGSVRFYPLGGRYHSGINKPNGGSNGGSSAGSGAGGGVVQEKDFDANSLDFENNVYFVHRTSGGAAKQIMGEGFRNRSGDMDGTAVRVYKPEHLKELFDGQREADRNKDWSNAVHGGSHAVIIKIPKSRMELPHSGRISSDTITQAVSQGYGGLIPKENLATVEIGR